MNIEVLFLNICAHHKSAFPKLSLHLYFCCLSQLKPVRSFESFGSRSYTGAGTSTLGLNTQNFLGATCVPPISNLRCGAPVSPPATTFENLSSHVPVNQFTPQRLESQQAPLAFSTPKMNAFTPSPDNVFTSFAQVPCSKNPTVPTSSIPISSTSMPLTALSARPSCPAKVCSKLLLFNFKIWHSFVLVVLQLMPLSNLVIKIKYQRMKL